MVVYKKFSFSNKQSAVANNLSQMNKYKITSRKKIDENMKHTKATYTKTSQPLKLARCIIYKKVLIFFML